MVAKFEGFPKGALKFLRDLKKNNDRDWFEANKTTYVEKIKEPMERLVASVGADMMKWGEEFVTEPKKAIYRIYRDTRFSSDKTPYKTHAGASFFRQDLGKHTGAGFYFEISPEHVGGAGGVYMVEPDDLRMLRTHISGNMVTWNKLVSSKKLVTGAGQLQGHKLSRPPKGFAVDDPAAEWLKYKQLYYWVELPAALAESPNLLPTLLERFRLMLPVMRFLNEPLCAKKKKLAPLEQGWI